MELKGFSVWLEFTSLKCCCFSTENLDKLVLIMKNYLDDCRLGCVFSPLVKLMEEYLEDVLLEENEELLLKSNLFKEDNEVLC